MLSSKCPHGPHGYKTAEEPSWADTLLAPSQLAFQSAPGRRHHKSAPASPVPDLSLAAYRNHKMANKTFSCI